MNKGRESAGGTHREADPSLPFAGGRKPYHDELLDYYFGHPSSASTEQPLGRLHGVADDDEERYI